MTDAATSRRPRKRHAAAMSRIAAATASTTAMFGIVAYLGMRDGASAVSSAPQTAAPVAQPGTVVLEVRLRRPAAGRRGSAQRAAARPAPAAPVAQRPQARPAAPLARAAARAAKPVTGTNASR